MQYAKISGTGSYLPANRVSNDDHALSYHSNLDCWEYSDDSESIVLHSAKRGQEFVIDSTYYPQLENWLTNIIKNHV